MKRWSLILPVGYFLFLFVLAFAFDFPREVTRQWLWIQVGGIVFMAVLGGYLDGSTSQKEVVTAGLFTLLWLGLAFAVNIQKEYFALLGLAIELILALLVKR